MKDRIEALLDRLQLSPTRFADELSIQRSGMSHILSGRNKPSLDLIQKILNRWPEVNGDWLVQGKGGIFLEDNAVTLAAPSLVTTVITPEKPEEPLVEVQPEELATPPVPEPLPIPVIVSPNPVTKLEPRPQLALFDIPPVAHPQKTMPAAEEKSKPQPKTEPAIAKESVETKIPPSSKDKKIQRIVFFYTDNTFSVFNPE